MNSSRCWLIFLAAVVVFAIYLPAEDADAQRRRRGRRGGSGWDFVAKKYDSNKDQTVTAEEYTRGTEALKGLDNNGDGVLTKDDWTGRAKRRTGDAPEVGATAPDFSLTQVDDETKVVTLSSFKDKQPVALIFGSCS